MVIALNRGEVRDLMSITSTPPLVPVTIFQVDVALFSLLDYFYR